MPTDISIGVHDHPEGGLVALTLSTVLSMGNTYFLDRDQADQLATKLKTVVRSIPKPKKLAVPAAEAHARPSGLVVPG
jgi:hypothetical protein